MLHYLMQFNYKNVDLVYCIGSIFLRIQKSIKIFFVAIECVRKYSFYEEIGK